MTPDDLIDISSLFRKINAPEAAAQQKLKRFRQKMERFVKPLPTGDPRRHPWIIESLLVESEVFDYRHLHCAYYESCLNDAARTIKNNQTWACPQKCPGRKTYKEFDEIKISDELRDLILGHGN